MEAALHKATRILQAAAQTEAGLTRKLERAGYDEATIAEVCGRLRRAKYLDDAAFAAARVRRRLAQGRRASVIAAELREKGIDRETIAALLGSAHPEDGE